MSKQHRLIVSKPKGKDFVAGGKRRLGGAPILSDGHWTLYLPPDDIQNKYVETEACATYATLHCVEILARQEFGDAAQYSDRFLAKISGTTREGNDPHIVMESLRTKGVVKDGVWPYTSEMNNWEAFYADIPVAVESLALGFPLKYDFGHQYDYTDPARMMQALNWSPLAVGVWAWNAPDENGIYHRNGIMQDDHMVTLIGYKLPGT